MNPISRRSWFAFQSDASCCRWNLSCIPWKGSAWELLHCHGCKVKYMVASEGSGGKRRKMTSPFGIIYIYETFCTFACYISPNFNWASHKHHNRLNSPAEHWMWSSSLQHFSVIYQRHDKTFSRHQFISKATLFLKKNRQEIVVFSGEIWMSNSKLSFIIILAITYH